MRPRYLLLLLCAIAISGGSAFAADDSELTEHEKMQLVDSRYETYRKDFPGIAEIEVFRGRKLLAEGEKVIFIDTRRPEERAVSTLPGAMSKEAYLASRDTYHDHLKIAYCTIGYRSGMFSRDMARAGDTIYNLRGGILAWTLAGGVVYGEGKPVKRLHVFAERWNYAPRGYETETFSLFRQLF